MNIIAINERLWNCRLTDFKSVRIRFALSLIWSLPVLFGFWLLRNSWRESAVLAAAFLYLSLLGLILDRWRLRNPDAPKERETQLRFFGVVPLVVGIIVAMCLVT